MGIEIIKSEIDMYIDMLRNHSKDMYILDKAHREIQELYNKLNELNDTYNQCIDDLIEGNEVPY